MIHERIVSCELQEDLDELDAIYATKDLIRCKDCEHFTGIVCDKELPRILRNPDWFCADGERRANQ